jgi:ABC-type nitrate/sulfonate/bicarbonate transport system substrate-binding protein
MTPRLKRTSTLIAGFLALAAALFAALGGPAGAEAPLKVRLGVVTVSSQMALQIAVAKGFFARHGFDVELRPIASGAQANQALASGQVDWSAGGIESTIVAASTGLAFKPYAMYAKGGDSLGILVRADADIHDARDLKGKRVAVVAGTASAQGLSQLLKANGLAETDVKRVNANFGTMGQMLVAGSVDAIVALEPFLTVTQDKMGKDAVLLTRLGKYVQGGGFFLMSDAWVAAHPKAVEPAVEALAEALQFVRQHPDEAAKLNAGFVKADPAIIERSSKVFDFTCDIDPFTIASLKTTSAYLAAQKAIAGPVDTDKLLAPALRVTGELRKAHPDLWK